MLRPAAGLPPAGGRPGVFPRASSQASARAAAATFRDPAGLGGGEHQGYPDVSPYARRARSNRSPSGHLRNPVLSPMAHLSGPTVLLNTVHPNGTQTPPAISEDPASGPRRIGA